VIEKLRLFLTILEEGSLRRAAERCRISQSAITRQIQLLEHDLGGRVLERTSKQISISQLKNESFVRLSDDVALGYNQKIVRFCRQFGKFRPRFVSIGIPATMIEGLMTMANEGAIALSPTFISHLVVPNVVMIPIAEKEATWDLFVVWQSGKTAGPLRALLDCLQSKPKAPRRPG
jgi:DNA-binding transcriptional LysR family regulator